MTRLGVARAIFQRDPTALTEADWQSLIVDVARTCGWRHYHTHDSRRSPHGFPDLVLVHRKHGVVFAELKSSEGKLTEKQAAWVEDLMAAGAKVYVWRPEDWDAVVEVLSGGMSRRSGEVR